MSATQDEQSGLQQGQGSGAPQPSVAGSDEDTAVAAILGDLTEGDLDPVGDVAGPGGAGGRDDSGGAGAQDSTELDQRLHRLDEAHRHLRALLDQPDA